MNTIGKSIKILAFLGSFDISKIIEMKNGKWNSKIMHKVVCSVQLYVFRKRMLSKISMSVICILIYTAVENNKK